MSLATIALLAWALIVAAGDWRWRRIPNGLLLLAWIPGIVVFGWREQGLLDQSLLASAVGLAMGFAVLLPGFAWRVVGGGDVKFAACCGWFLGGTRCGLMLLAMALALGLTSLVVVARRAKAPELMTRVAAGPAIAIGFAAALLIHVDV